MTDVIDQRELYSEVVDGVHITVHAMMERDDESDPGDADCYGSNDLDAWKRDEWEYVSFIVAVEVNHTAIGFGSNCSVEHGIMGEGIDVDAWHFTVPEYGQTKAGREWVAAGSPLNGAVIEAIDSARAWLKSVGMAEVTLLDPVAKWADPNAPKTKATRRP